MPKLYLIGAGPGDPDLISRKALKILAKADVVLYDSLINPVLLEETSPECIHENVGKRGRQKSTAQEEINQLIADYAQTKECIVRLKGGDPMIFGRSFEEIVWAKSQGIEVEVVPGISSINSFAAAYQAPITKRKESYGFWVISGTTHLNELSHEVQLAAQSSSNILIFMGLYKLDAIVNTFLQYKDSEYPIGIFEAISTPHQRALIGTLGDIVAKSKENQMASPALVVLGKVLDDVEPN